MCQGEESMPHDQRQGGMLQHSQDCLKSFKALRQVLRGMVQSASNLHENWLSGLVRLC